jgi:class 3 adenylate cyclase
LAEFQSIVDAVRCAAEIQRGMIDREPEVPDERRISFRIGVNLGDVIAEGGDIFGDGVNVAARLEALAEPGGICVSGTVRDQVRAKLPYALDDLGEQSVKNIARPGPCTAPRSCRGSAGAECAIRGVARQVHHLRRNGGGRCSRARHRRRRLVGLDGDKILLNSAGSGRSRRDPNFAATWRAAPLDSRAALCQSQRRPRAAIFR